MGTVKPLKEITQKSAFPHQLYVYVFLSKLSSYQSHLNLVEHVSICRPSQSNNKFPCLFPERQRYWNKLQNNSGLTNSSLSQRKNHLVFLCCHVNRSANIPAYRSVLRLRCTLADGFETLAQSERCVVAAPHFFAPTPIATAGT